MKPEEKLSLIIEFNDICKKEIGIQVLHPCLVGISGVGKSSIVKQLYPNARIVDLSLLLTEEVGGLPRIDNKAGITKYFLPEWFQYDVIFFEEIDKVEKEKLAPLLSLLTNFELHGANAKNKLFIFACQPEWLASDYFDDTLEAFLYRLIFIPIFQKDSFAYLQSQNYQIPQNFLNFMTQKEKNLAKFKIPYNPRVYQYVYEFTKYLAKKFKYDKEKTLNTAKEIFWYFEPSEVISFIVENCLKINVNELDEEEIILLLDSMNTYELIEILPKIQHKLDAKTFFKHFTKLYVNSSVDERKKFFDNFYNALLQTEEFTMEQDFDEIAYYFIVSFYVASKLLNENKEFIEYLERHKNELQKFLKEAQEFENFVKGGDKNEVK